MILFLHFDYLRNHLIQYFKIVLESFAAASGIVDHDALRAQTGEGKPHSHAVVVVGGYGTGLWRPRIDGDAVLRLFAQRMPIRVSSVQMAWMRSLSWKRM